MSHAKFAAVTGSLLARKGEAVPWCELSPSPRVWTRSAEEAPAGPLGPPPARPWAEPGHVPSPPSAIAGKNGGGDRMHKYAVHMTECDYEKLGLIAVKHGTTRQQLMQRALAEFLAATAREYRGECGCLEACSSPGDGAAPGA